MEQFPQIPEENCVMFSQGSSCMNLSHLNCFLMVQLNKENIQFSNLEFFIESSQRNMFLFFYDILLSLILVDKNTKREEGPYPNGYQFVRIRFQGLAVWQVQLPYFASLHSDIKHFCFMPKGSSDS